MDAPVSLPAWLLLLLSGLALLAVLDRILVPGGRWFLRQRTNRVIDRLNTRLRIQIPPFKITKREVLVERVVYHPRVMEAAEERPPGGAGWPPGPEDVDSAAHPSHQLPPSDHGVNAG